ncbi:MAG: tetratricopeptide repeat protein [Nitrospirae bacterium]|nr:tetratricopeptide repeat protein [Nitrospirota bacterium]
MFIRLFHSKILILCLFTGIGILVFANSFSNSFQYDDQVTVEYNRNIRTVKNIPYFFLKPRMLIAGKLHESGGHYRPLIISSYAINYAIGGLNPTGYHIVNLAFHAVSAFLIFLIIRAMSGSVWSFAAIAAGLIFLVHPFNSEAVNYITARSSVMSGFFYLLAFYFWVKYRSEKTAHFYIFSLLAFVAGMLCKEVVITLPVVLWLSDVYGFGRVRTGQTVTGSAWLLNWRNYMAYLPFVLIVAIPYLVIRIFSFGRLMPGFSRDIVTQILTELPVLVKHLQMFIFPAPLSVYHQVEIYKTFWSFPVIYSVIILLVYTFIAVFLFFKASQSWRVVSFFMLWFFIVLLPTTIIPLNDIFQENRGYMALVSFAVFAGVAIGELFRTKLKSAAVIVLAALLTVYSIVSFQRNMIWKDELTLWSDALNKTDKSPEVYTAISVAYRRAGMYNQAIEASEEALALGGQKNFVVHENLGMIYLAQRKLDMAAMELEKAAEGYPDKAQIHYNLGVVYYRQDRLDLAEKSFREALRIDPEYHKPYLNLGILYMRQGRAADAHQALVKAMSLSPGDLSSRFYLGILSEGTGNKEEAAQYYHQVLEHAGEGDKALLQDVRSRLEKIEQ